MAKKVYEEKNISAVADKIREKTGKDATYKTSEMPEGVERVYEAGEKAEYDRFWDSYQRNGILTNYNYAFAGRGWNDELFKPKYPISIINHATYMFSTSGITNIDFDMDLSKVTSTPTDTFAHSDVETIKSFKFSAIYDMANCFKYAYKLKNININGEISVNASFKDCSLLTHDSLMSIINALKDFGTAKIQCEFETGPFDNQVTYFMEKYEIVDMGDSYITVATDDYGDIRVPLFGDFKAAEYSNATHVVFNNSSSFTLYLPTTVATKTLTLGSANLAKLTDEEKKKATAKGWELK